MSTNSKVVLVTGGAGYIGSHVCTDLLDQGYSVVVLDNLSTGFREAVDERARFYQGDVGDSHCLKKLFSENQVDSVIHLAASLIVEESVSNPKLYYRNNVLSSLTLLKALENHGISKIVFSSTAAVYGEVGGQEALVETDACLPINPYGKSKYFCEEMIRDVSNSSDLKHVILRYFNVAGASSTNGQRHKNATHLIKVLSEVVAGKRNKIQIYGDNYPTKDGTCVRDYIHILDLAKAHVLALKHLETGGASDVFNCGYSQGITVLEALRSMEKVSGKKILYDIVERRRGDVSAVIAGSDKIKQVMGWTPKYNSIDQICKSAYEWELKYR